MPIKVHIPTPLRRLTGGAALVELDGLTVAQLIDELDRRHPGIKDILCAEDGQLHRFINILSNNKDIRIINGLGTALHDGDEVSISPALSRG